MIGFVIGDSDMITGFKLVGIEGSEVTTIEEARQAFYRSLLRNDIGIIIISGAFFSDTSYLSMRNFNFDGIHLVAGANSCNGHHHIILRIYA
jgi:vacuolar-type H+-ATPase subunit F/Vma7